MDSSSALGETGHGDSTPSSDTDLDGDGYVEGDDCDDLDAAVNPGAIEVCNGLDDDCDGVTDGESATDARTWYPDDDDDVYGDGTRPLESCIQPQGYVLFDGDCDDTDPAVHEGATETCDGVDNNCSGSESDALDATAYHPDRDGDGFGALEMACSPPGDPEGLPDDCDDTRDHVYPGAPESCDGTDENCDGVIDDDAVDASVWYTDGDADGFGDPDSFEWNCDAPAGMVADGQDCDDANDAVGTRTWYEDADGDGFGVLARTACDAPEGHAPHGGDCDDADSTVHPGASEACDGTSDLNCDGSVGTADADADGVAACEDCDDGDAAWHAPPTWFADADHDAYGDPTVQYVQCYSPVWFVADDTDCDDADDAAHPNAYEVWYDDVDQACDGGSDWDSDADGYDHEDDDCLDSDPTVNPGALEVCNDGLDNNCDGGSGQCVLEGTVSLGDAHARYLGENTSDNAGWCMAGFDDALSSTGRSLAVCGESAAGAKGAVWIVRDPTGGQFSLGDAGTRVDGEAVGNSAGSSITSAGDLDADGIADIVVGDYVESSYLGGAGAAYVVSGATSGIKSLSTALAKVHGAEESEYAGVSLAGPGDVDGDGYADLVVGALRNDSGGEDAGATYVMFGPLSGTVSVSTAGAKLIGEEAYDMAGASVSAGDMDGDGVFDTIVGTADQPSSVCDPGQVYVASGVTVGTLHLEDSDAIVRGAGSAACTGWSVSTAGDVDGDGATDLVIGAIGDTAYDAFSGSAHVLLGPLSGESQTSNAAWSVYGTAYLEQVGWSVADAGDVDQDGHGDVLVGRLEGTAARPGQANLYYGPMLGTTTFDLADFRMDGEHADDWAGYAVSGVGDADADGFPDLMVGAYRFTDAYNYQGAAYLYFGGGL